MSATLTNATELANFFYAKAKIYMAFTRDESSAHIHHGTCSAKAVVMHLMLLNQAVMIHGMLLNQAVMMHLMFLNQAVMMHLSY
jgi:hypothetical protein